MRTCFLYLLFLLWFAESSQAQSDKRWLKHEIATLSGAAMHGRGYVNKGGEKAAMYLRRKFKEFGLLPFTSDSSYFQPYSFSVNTFPGEAYLKLQKREMLAGVDYIVNAASSSYYTTGRLKVKTVRLKNVKDTLSWNSVKSKFTANRAYLLKDYDTAVKYITLTSRKLAENLPKGLFILPQHGKLTWPVARDTVASTVYYVEDTVMPRRIKRVEARLDTKFLPAFGSNNVIGYVPGTEQPDSFVLFTAHYDHLGRMGRNTLFPGAHDNASGTALMLYMARYFAEHPAKYTTVFIGFSGEEAGLLGSAYFTEHPPFPLNNVRFVVNMDMTGDATDGITVVNATEQKEAFGLLNQINDQKRYLPKIVERGQTQNSDHYYFSKHGVPAVFIYGNGTKPYYHDVFDKAQELSLENIDGLIKLLVDFTGRQ